MFNYGTHHLTIYQVTAIFKKLFFALSQRSFHTNLQSSSWSFLTG